MRDLAVKNALEHPQQVASTPDHPGCSEDSVYRLGLKRAVQHQELTYKSVQERQSDRCQHNKEVGSRVNRHGTCQSPELRNLIRVTPLMQNPCKHEQATRRNTMSQHHEHGSIQSGLCETENSEHNEAQVAYR